MKLHTDIDSFINEKISFGKNFWKKKKPEDFGITEYKWNNNKLDVFQDVSLVPTNIFNKLSELPFDFGIVEGNFDCCSNRLTSLKFSPEKINGRFDCNLNKLSDLDHGPKYVETYLCMENPLEGLETYPLCIIQKTLFSDAIENSLYNRVSKIIYSNLELFKTLLDNKENFHKTLISFDPSLYEEYINWHPPIRKNSKLLF